MKTAVQTNLSLLERLEKVLPHDLASAKDLISNNFVWHYFNPSLPEIAGDYVGLSGLQAFFQKLGALTNDTFRVSTLKVIPVGEELVVVHANPSMSFADESFELDAVVVWRIVSDRIIEAWDIPAVYTLRPPTPSDQLKEVA
ncbi:MAG: nuclear transport factor 2 family protein [Cyanobacteria bacterium P01_H01_bin.162]